MGHDYWKWWGLRGDGKNSNLWLKYVGNTVVEWKDTAGSDYNTFQDFSDNNYVKTTKLFLSQSRLEYNIKKVNLDKHFDVNSEGEIEQSADGGEETEAVMMLKGYLESDLWVNERMTQDTGDYINSDIDFAQIGPSLSMHQKLALLMQMAKRSAYEVQGDNYKVYPLQVTFNWGLRYDKWRALMLHLQNDLGHSYAQSRKLMKEKYMPYYFRNYDWNNDVTQAQTLQMPIAEKVEIRCENAMIDSCRAWDDATAPNRYQVEISFLVRIGNMKLGSWEVDLDNYVTLLGDKKNKPGNRTLEEV